MNGIDLLVPLDIEETRALGELADRIGENPMNLAAYLLGEGIIHFKQHLDELEERGELPCSACETTRPHQRHLSDDC
jgi:hypothetical protein